MHNSHQPAANNLNVQASGHRPCHTFYEWQGEALLLRIKVQPETHKNEFCDVINDRLKIKISASPVKGKANQQLIKYLAEQFKVRKSQVSLLSGEHRREKRCKITAPQKLPRFIQRPVI